MKFTLFRRDIAPYLTDRYSERVESAGELSARVSLPAAVDGASAPKQACGCARTCRKPA
jgi:arsenic resistance protein ArsH